MLGLVCCLEVRTVDMTALPWLVMLGTSGSKGIAVMYHQSAWMAGDD